MRLHLCLWLLLAFCCGSAAADGIRVNECRGAHGERVFTDAVGCADASVREWVLPPPPAAPALAPTPASAEEPRSRRRGGGRPARAAKQPDSYLCSSGNQSWYQHGPCRRSGEKGESVRQAKVSREQACREIARPASALRKGSERDERAGPYARATGRDPCG